MTSLPKRRCSHIGCREYVPCSIHIRPSPAQRGYGGDWNQRRKRILERDGHRCTNCGSTWRLNVDHIRPRSQGGSDDDSNLQTLCGRCHSTKTATKDGGFGNG